MLCHPNRNFQFFWETRIMLEIWGMLIILIHPLILPTLEKWVGTSSSMCFKRSLASAKWDKFIDPQKMGQLELKLPLGWIFVCSKWPCWAGGSTHCQKVGFGVGLTPIFTVGQPTTLPKLKHEDNPLQNWMAKWHLRHAFDPLLKSGFWQWVSPLSWGGSSE